MSNSIFERILSPIRRKIMLMIGKCILAAVDNSGKVMKLQLDGLKNEDITDIERYQEYGFESYPKKDSEALAIFIDGNRDNGIVICVNDRRYRPTNLSEGDACVYDYRGNRIDLKNSGILITDKNGNTVELNSSGVKILNGSSSFVKGETLQTQLNVDKTAMQTLQAAISAWTPVAHDGGAALKLALTAFLALPMADYSNVLSIKIKGE